VVKTKEFYALSEEELLERLGSVQPNSAVAYAIEAEFRRRALNAQIAASNAARKTAQWTRYSAIAIMISVIVMAAGSTAEHWAALKSMASSAKAYTAGFLAWVAATFIG